jgi:prephenate dehydrogenase
LADILRTNASNITKGIDKTIVELQKLKKAIKNDNKKEVEKLLEKAITKRATLIKYKIKKKELIS